MELRNSGSVCWQSVNTVNVASPWNSTSESNCDSFVTERSWKPLWDHTCSEKFIAEQLHSLTSISFKFTVTYKYSTTLKSLGTYFLYRITRREGPPLSVYGLQYQQWLKMDGQVIAYAWLRIQGRECQRSANGTVHSRGCVYVCFWVICVWSGKQCKVVILLWPYK